jgi:GNAT superfamily N-acetyltransferase
VNFTVRTGTLEDARGIAQVHVQSWLETYTNLMPSELLESITLESREVQWERTFQNDVGVFVAVVRDEIVGFCSVGRRDGVFELFTLYLLKSHQGAGIGFALWQRALEYAKARDVREMVLWVLETNPTRRFYERQGGQLEGRKVEMMHGTKLVEVGYRFQIGKS